MAIFLRIARRISIAVRRIFQCLGNLGKAGEVLVPDSIGAMLPIQGQRLAKLYPGAEGEGYELNCMIVRKGLGVVMHSRSSVPVNLV
jgi:hypothetical protein